MLSLRSGLELNKLFPDSCSSPEMSSSSLQSLKRIHRKEAPVCNIRDIVSMHAFLVFVSTNPSLLKAWYERGRETGDECRRVCPERLLTPAKRREGIKNKQKR